MQIPPSLVLGCNTQHGIGVLSDWVEEHMGYVPDFFDRGWSSNNSISSGYRDGEGYGFGDSYGLAHDGTDGRGYGDNYDYGHDDGNGNGGSCDAFPDGDGEGNGSCYGHGDGNGSGNSDVYDSDEDDYIGDVFDSYYGVH